MRIVLAALLLAPGAAAAAEGTTGVQLGYGRRIGEGAEGLSILGLRADLLFGRDAQGELAAGIHAGVHLPDPFHEIQGDLGLSLLVPALDAWPIVLSGGGFVGSGPARAGILGRIFWGVRPQNAFSWYVTTIGLFVEARAALAGTDAVDVSAGLHVDGFALLYPFVVLFEMIRHGSP